MEIQPVNNVVSPQKAEPLQLNKLAREVLEVESVFLCPRDRGEAEDKLAKIVARLKREDFSGLEPAAKLKRTHRILREEFKVRFRRDDIPNRPGVTANLFSISLISGWLDCDTMSQLFLIIGRELDWPLHLVKAPHHAFIRWEDQNNKFNYETTDNWTPTDDDFIDHFQIKPADIESGAFMRTLSDDEGRALIYWNRGRVRGEFGDWAGARQDMLTAIRLDPIDPKYQKDLATADRHLTEPRY